jgi:hypothetical protein
VLPAVFYIIGRYQVNSGIENINYQSITSFYNNPQLDRARTIAFQHEQLRLDMQKISASTDKDAVVMWYAPKYIHLLAQRRAVPFPNYKNSMAYLRAVRDSGANYIYLTRFNPRNTFYHVNGLEPLTTIARIATPIWSENDPSNRQLVSVLLRVDNKQLENAIGNAQDLENNGL